MWRFSCSLAEDRRPPASSVMTPLICCQALSARLLVERLKQPEPKWSQMCVSPDGWSQSGKKGAVVRRGRRRRSRVSLRIAVCEPRTTPDPNVHRSRIFRAGLISPCSSREVQHPAAGARGTPVAFPAVPEFCLRRRRGRALAEFYVPKLFPHSCFGACKKVRSAAHCADTTSAAK